jgi:hypothetical protein
MKAPAYSFIVRVRANTTKDDVRRYILSAVREMRGCKRPDDPLFHIKSRDVSVKPLPGFTQ